MASSRPFEAAVAVPIAIGEPEPVGGLVPEWVSIVGPLATSAQGAASPIRTLMPCIPMNTLLAPQWLLVGTFALGIRVGLSRMASAVPGSLAVSD